MGVPALTVGVFKEREPWGAHSQESSFSGAAASQEAASALGARCSSLIEETQDAN